MVDSPVSPDAGTSAQEAPMYTPAHFSLTDSDSLHGLIRSHPLGTLVTQANGVLDANHLPFLLDADPGEMGTLSAHVARANPLWQQCRDGAEVLVVFRGAEGYISPSWYPSKHETHRLVPTWNYEAVHVHGQIRSEEHTSELQSQSNLVCRLLLEKKKQYTGSRR